MRKTSLFVLLSCLLFTTLHAQQELNTQLLRGTWQANRTNPALLPGSRFTIGLPGFYDNVVITGVTYNDLIEEKGGETVLNISQAIDQLEANNLIRENLDVETISFGVQIGRFFVSLGHTLRFNAFLDYPKTLPQLIWEGNAQFIGQEVDFGFDLHLFSHHEFALGLAVQPIKGLTIGGRAKLLSGLADISTDRRRLSLLTDDDVYQLTLNSDFRVNASSTLSYDGFSDLTIDFDFGRFDTEELFSNNRGYAFDFGAHIDLGRLDIAASVLDIGQIDWDNEVRNYSLQGSFEYKGLDVAQGILEDSTEFGSTLDTLQAIYDPVETTIGYSTKLPTRYYLSSTYQLTERLRLGGVFYAESYRDRSFTAFALGANYQLLPILNLGASYSYRNETYDNIGINATLNAGPLQIVAATDNILTAFRPADSNTANARVGINLLFGKVEKEHWDDVSDQEGFF